MAKVFVALSGGVDSSVAAALLKEAGFDTVGVHMVCWDGCEQGEERHDALRVALQLDIPFLSFDFRKEYKRRSSWSVRRLLRQRKGIGWRNNP